MVLNKLLSVGSGKKLKKLKKIADYINTLEDDLEKLSDKELKDQTNKLKSELEAGKTLDDILPEAFATVREASKRVFKKRHFDVQLMGGVALHFGWVAEMKTGEGKTLVSTLPAYLNALSGSSVHIVTVNDYLANRDAKETGQLYKFLGMDVGIISSEHGTLEDKKLAYSADITYGTNNEFGFDYLRDNMAVSAAEQVQRGHQFAIVDEVDSILIDEARTPLIISGRIADKTSLYTRFARIAKSLKAEDHYEVDEQFRRVITSNEGITAVEEQLGVDNLYDDIHQNYVHQLDCALQAKELFKEGKDYIVQNGEVKIVDEFTGRILEGRRWSDGLHQAVEAKEGVRVKEENQTLATVTLQNYYKQYEKLSGMTGTAMTESSEFLHTYKLEVVEIPTNRPSQRDDRTDFIYKTESAKFNAVAKDILERHKAGQPVLVGTVSVEKSERLSTILTRMGIEHEVLNAKNHFREGEIITQAGKKSAVTVSTNMAGRGVDILLGGNPVGFAEDEFNQRGIPLSGKEFEDNKEEFEELVEKFTKECAIDREEIIAAGGLYVLGTERHESRRIDNQLRGRSGRQGDPGETRFYLSLEDELMRLFANNMIEWAMNAALPEDTPLETKLVSRAIEKAQRTVETRNFESRKSVLDYDQVLDQQRKVIYTRRQSILDGEDIHDRAMEMCENAISFRVNHYCASEYIEEWNVSELFSEIRTFFPTTVSEVMATSYANTQEIEKAFLDDLHAYYEKREQNFTPEIMRGLERNTLLSVIDSYWKDHLGEMDHLREGINLRGIAQQDPLSEWQKEGFINFESMLEMISRDFVVYILNLEEEVQEKSQLENTVAEKADDSETGSGATGPKKNGQVIKNEETVGRNDLCTCGSGKKYKFCHGS